MAPILTILIPNYNRPRALQRLLTSVYRSIDAASASESVRVLVIDDFSDPPVENAVRNFTERENFLFRMHVEKRGNAELAFLSSLALIGTEYTWLLGNDDIVSADAVGHVLRLIDSNEYGLILLNPRIYKGEPAVDHAPILSASPTVVYEYASDLFADFGFVTSTTTFPCLIFKTGPVRRFHEQVNLTAVATVYSHTFTLFGALRNEPAIFISSTLVGFTLNERLEEQNKLERQAPGRIMFYHQSLGLVRLVKACSSATDVPIKFFGACLEDEVDKDRMIVAPTLLSHFISFFTLEQLIREHENIINGRPEFGHFRPGDLAEIRSVVEGFQEPIPIAVLSTAGSLFNSMSVSPEWKVEQMRRVQQDLLSDARGRYFQKALVFGPSAVALKLHVPDYRAVHLKGSPADHLGKRLH